MKEKIGFKTRIVRFFGWNVMLLSILLAISMIGVLLTQATGFGQKVLFIVMFFVFILLAKLGWKIKNCKGGQKLSSQPSTLEGDFAKKTAAPPMNGSTQMSHQPQQVKKFFEKPPDNNFNEENWKKMTSALKEREEAKKLLSEQNKTSNITEANEIHRANDNNTDCSSDKEYDEKMSRMFQYFYTQNSICRIGYQKYGDDKILERDIEIKSIEIGLFDDPSYIYAYCYLREADRQFRLDRIISLSVNDENIDNPERFFTRLYYNSPQYKTDKALQEHQNEIQLMVFFARADGAMRKNERKIITTYFIKYIDGVPFDFVDDSLKELQCELSLTTILRRAKNMPSETKVGLFDVISQIYSLKNNPSKIEEGVFEKLKKALSV